MKKRRRRGRRQPSRRRRSMRRRFRRRCRRCRAHLFQISRRTRCAAADGDHVDAVEDDDDDDADSAGGLLPPRAGDATAPPPDGGAGTRATGCLVLLFLLLPRRAREGRAGGATASKVLVWRDHVVCRLWRLARSAGFARLVRRRTPTKRGRRRRRQSARSSPTTAARQSMWRAPPTPERPPHTQSLTLVTHIASFSLYFEPRDCQTKK
jgi:hypothetical protein